MRHGEWGGRGGGGAPQAGAVTHSLGGGAGHRQRRQSPDPRPPRKPSEAQACGTALEAPRHPSLLSLPRSTSRPPLFSRGTKNCRRGTSGNSLDPCARRCPVRLPAPPPRGRCPGALPHGAGRRAPSAPGAVTRVGAVCRSHPDPRGSCAITPGSLVPPGYEPPSPGLSRPARHGQHPPLPLAAAPTSAPAAARALRAPVLPTAAGCRRAQVSPHLMPRPPGKLGPPAT